VNWCTSCLPRCSTTPIRLEFGGWRVWVDTLAITHSKVRTCTIVQIAQRALSISALLGLLSETQAAMQGKAMENPDQSPDTREATAKNALPHAGIRLVISVIATHNAMSCDV